jgi:hypothetical protein
MRDTLRPVAFQHLRKTAGTSLADTLRLFFRPERAIAADDHLPEDVSIQNVLAGFRNHDFVTGHVEFLSCARADAFKVAVFRNPLARLLSERRQWMQARPENIAAAPANVANTIVALQQRSITEILESVFNYPVLAPGFWNHQTTALGAWPLLRESARIERASAYKWHAMHEHFDSGSDLRTWLLENKAEVMRRALASLKMMDYVGLTEDFDDSVREIFARIGLPEPGDVVVRNARNAFDDEAAPEIGDIAREFIEWDQELYEAAAERHAVFGRVARGMPVDYIGHTLSATQAVIVSSGDAPGGHGWHVRHRRPEGGWARWSGPGPESRIAVSAPIGIYSMKLEVFGAVSEAALRKMTIEIEGRQLSTEVGYEPSGIWIVSTIFERVRGNPFDIVLRFPGLDSEYGMALKQISFAPISDPNALPINVATPRPV